jgi:hypothetical protein
MNDKKCTACAETKDLTRYRGEWLCRLHLCPPLSMTTADLEAAIWGNSALSRVSECCDSAPDNEKGFNWKRAFHGKNETTKA